MEDKKAFEKTKYPGVFYQTVKRTGSLNDTDKSYVVFWIDQKARKQRSEHVGRQFRDGMTAARAAQIRAGLIEGTHPAKREIKKEARESQENRWDLDRIWARYVEYNPNVRAIANDQNRYEKHIKPLFGHLTPEEIEESDVDDLKIRLLETHQKATVNHILELLRRICNWGAKKIKVKGSYLKGLTFTIEMVKNVDNEKTGYLTPQQRGALIKAAMEYPERQIGDLIFFMYCTGLRKGEAFRLRWEDISWDENVIWLQETKTGVRQFIPITEVVKEILIRHPRIDNNPFVFAGRDGQMKTDIKHSAKTIFRAAGLPDDFRIHDLRHAYACSLAERGVEMAVISKLLRHSSVTITERRYIRFSPGYLGNKAEKIGDVVREALAEGGNRILPFPKRTA